jgi:UDP-hydrolysing UDP-N-acetyl-D-glucosamine 2-epimerase
MSKKKICVVTGTRAEYGLLYWLMKEIDNDPDFNLQIIATGMHLSPEYGLTYQEIEKDGFTIQAKVEMLLSSDTSVGTAKSLGLGIMGFTDAFNQLQPDLLVLLGDRYEILAAAQTAMIMKIPIAHIAGGDTTEGAFDEAIRHSITKMSHLHFVTNEVAAQRVRQMGENPEFIFNVGSLGIDAIKKIDLVERDELERILDFRFRKKNLLITFHPVTLDSQPSTIQFQNLLDALGSLDEEVGLIFTKPNSDPESRGLMKMLDEFVTQHANAKAYTSLGQRLYLSTVEQVDAVVGNSSSGLYEVPSFNKPTVNIGNRQRGRLQASSIINCKPETSDILHAIREAFSKDCSATINPYGDGNSAERIISILKQIPNFKDLLMKRFFEVALE